MIKPIKFILILIALVLEINICFGQNKGEIVAKNGIYAMIDISRKENWPISLLMFFSEDDTVSISMDNIDSTIKSLLKEGEYVSLGLSGTRNAIIDMFDCTQQQALDAERKLNDDLDMTKFERKLINADSYGLEISYAKMQAFFYKVNKNIFDNDPVTSEGIPLEDVSEKYLILIAIVNMEKADNLNIEILN